jgi:putative transposon-encoded protein
MKILKLLHEKELIVRNFKGFLKRKVVPSGTSARVNCPKEYLGYDAYLIILENETNKYNRRKSNPKE